MDSVRYAQTCYRQHRDSLPSTCMQEAFRLTSRARTHKKRERKRQRCLETTDGTSATPGKATKWTRHNFLSDSGSSDRFVWQLWRSASLAELVRTRKRVSYARKTEKSAMMSGNYGQDFNYTQQDYEVDWALLSTFSIFTGLLNAFSIGLNIVLVTTFVRCKVLHRANNVFIGHLAVSDCLVALSRGPADVVVYALGGRYDRMVVCE
ncbi:hypothetical protein Bbelb_062380 [Branchiostoma belcheri]|nr:hypothetical protein Bbelb_062380 [Branchiostoma belcheri]